MSYEPSPYGTIGIIPADAMRDNRAILRTDERTDSNIPINAAYYSSYQRAPSHYDPYHHHHGPQGPPVSQPAPYPQQRYQTQGYHQPGYQQQGSYYQGGVAPAPQQYQQQGSYYQGGVSYAPQGPAAYPQSERGEWSGGSIPPAQYHVPYQPKVYSTQRYSHSSVFQEPSRREAGALKYFSGPHKLPEPLYKKRQYHRHRQVPVESYEISGGRRTPSIFGGGHRSPFSETSTVHSYRSIAPGSRDPGATRTRRQTVTHEETHSGRGRHYAPSHSGYPASIF